ncbi:MAG: protein-glutamate O-methyltransferase CheR [Eubacterium sp.]|jgi:chemotaxis protein methyltransferase CheR|nr:protein-glutamate O-methyltransferase CheR [Eubacterium sp.]
MLNQYEDFKKEFLNLAKIDLSSYKESQMKRRIDNFIGKNNCRGYVDFFQKIKSDRNLYDMFITYLTINVSEFYRNPEQWQTLEKIVIPHLISRHGKRLRVWSAACSTGDEPYTLAMVFSEFLSLSQLEIIATDLDKEVLSKAKKGYYNEKSVRGLPPKYRQKFFEKDASGLYKVSDSLKACITFQEQNLLKDPYPTDVDLLVCRNVLIYFTDKAKDGIYKGFAKSLKKDGVLFVGSTEQIIGAKQYGLESMKSFFYKKL